MSYEEFKKTNNFKIFISENNSYGKLKIRAYTASEAIPVRGLNIKISKMIDNQVIIFYEGKTNDSGLIEEIILPAPKQENNNEQTPKSIEYNLTSYYENKYSPTEYKITIYDGIYVIQNINIVPKSVLEEDFTWL